MTRLKRGMIIDINIAPGSKAETIKHCAIVTNNIYNQRAPVIQIVPFVSWSRKKNLINTNIEILPSKENGLNKKYIADCLQTRPIQYQSFLANIRGALSKKKIREIDKSLKMEIEQN